MPIWLIAALLVAASPAESSLLSAPLPGDAGARHAVTSVCDRQQIRLHSRILGEDRRLLVRLPQGYQDGDARYPVLLLLDADWHFDIVAGDVGLLSECSYISPHPAPRVIVVGVANVDRNRDFTPTPCPEQAGMRFPTSGQALAFRRFLNEEVLPLIDDLYRTTPFRILAGWSLGGLFTVETLLQPDSPFAVGLAVSPSLWWDDGWLLRQLQNGGFGGLPATPRQLVVTLGSLEEDRQSMVARATETFLDHVAVQPRDGLDVEQVTIEGLGHNYSPQSAFFQGLATIFDDLPLPAAVREQGLTAVDAYYAGLSERYRHPVAVPEDVYGALGWQLFEAGRRDEAGAVFTVWGERHPESAVARASLGAFCRETGDTARAAALLEEALVLERRAAEPRQNFVLDLERDLRALRSGE